MRGKYSQTIGVVGGMGSYATVNFFKQLVDSFPAEKEWDRPRIIIDNRCTLPSRVRVFLYNDPQEHEELVSSLADSTRGLLSLGCNYLIFICNTAHIFIDEVFERVPEARDKSIHIIEALAKDFLDNDVKSAYLLASEGTIESKIFPTIFNKYGLYIKSPTEQQFPKIRYFIEQVKQKNSSEKCKQEFLEYCRSLNSKDIILGCTELPIIVKNATHFENIRLWNPLTSAINVIKNKIH